MKNYNFLKMCVIGVIPLLMAVDCMSSAVMYCVLNLSATTVTALCLLVLQRVSGRSKYALAMTLSFAVNSCVFSGLLAGRYCLGVSSGVFLYASSLSVAGLYFDYEFKHFDGAFELTKHYLIVAASSVSIFFVYGALVHLFNEKPGGVTFFAYPCSAVITAALCAMVISRVLKKTV